MDAYCSICGQRYDIRDPAITLHPGPEWNCADEAACFERAAANKARDELAAAIEDALAAHTEIFPGDPS